MYNNKKICVVMPAYNAARTLERTYNDIPFDLVDDVILVDDASADDTVAVAEALGIHTVVHEKNGGYGANQKTCYRTALARGADIVVMVHPDHQYDPTLVPALVHKLVADNAEAAFGSRMARWSHALEGGMPWWKFGANIALTQFANLLLGTKLTEYHSGFRAYKREVFDKIDLDKNSDDFVFDTHIIVQLAHHGCQITEIPIGTRYFAEASQIGFWRSVKYGWGIVRCIVRYKATGKL